MITVTAVSKAFAGKKLFEDVNTTFPPGRRYGLTGPNGAGKSTFMKIMQGDLDYVALQQGEEFFTSLYRQGKRAEFVRYWGEGHVLESPANIRDMWRRIFAWFDQF